MSSHHQIPSTTPIVCDDKHENTTFDVHTGEEICTTCGLVLDKGISPNDVMCYSTILEEKSSTQLGFELMLRDKLLDICSILHFDGNALLIDTALHLYLELTKLPISEKTGGKAYSSSTASLQRQLFDHERNRECLAFCLWESLHRQGIAISAYKIAAVCEVLPSSLLKVEKDYKKSTTFCSLTEYVETCCNRLGFKYCFTKPTTQLANKVKCYFFGKNQDLIFIACLLSIYMHKKRYQAGDIDPYLEDICTQHKSRDEVIEVMKTFPEYIITNSNDLIFKK